MGNWFHKTYIEAEQQVNDFHPVMLPWQAHPDRDEEWFENETKNMSRRQIAQELECNFNTSGESVLHPSDIAKISERCCQPKYKTGFDRNLWIWEEYQPGNNYLMSADVARGDGNDYSVFHIFKLETMEQVAEYQGKLTPDLFSNLILQTGKEYGNCMAVVENNSVGFAVLEKLIEAGYPNVYYSAKNTHAYVEPLEAEHSSGVVAGFSTTSKTKPLIIAKLEEFARNDLITLYSSRTENEIKTFVWNHGRAAAMRGYNDDLVIACAIACWVKDIALSVGQRDLEYKKAFLDFGGVIQRKRIIDTTIPGMIGYNPLKQKKAEHDRQYAEYAWLYKG